MHAKKVCVITVKRLQFVNKRAVCSGTCSCSKYHQLCKMLNCIQVTAYILVPSDAAALKTQKCKCCRFCSNAKFSGLLGVEAGTTNEQLVKDVNDANRQPRPQSVK